MITGTNKPHFTIEPKTLSYLFTFSGWTSLVSARIAGTLGWIPRTGHVYSQEKRIHHYFGCILQLRLMTDVTFVSAIKILVQVRNRCVGIINFISREYGKHSLLAYFFGDAVVHNFTVVTNYIRRVKGDFPASVGQREIPVLILFKCRYHHQIF